MSASGDELQHLSILDVLERSEQTSQRAIAAATGINLAKVNFCLKKLIDKGHVKLRNVSQNTNKLKYLYIITPAGLTEKSRLTIRFLKRTVETYNRAEAKIHDNFRAMREQGIRRLALVGCGDLAEILIRLLEQDEWMTLVGIFAREGGNGSVLGYLLEPCARLTEFEFDRVLLIESEQFDSDLAFLEEQGVGRERIWLLG